MTQKITITDSTLRDGMHTVSHQFSPADMAEIARALDQAGMDLIEIGHGDGLAGSSYQYGFSSASDTDYLKAVCDVVKQAKVTVLLLPGIGTKKDLQAAAEIGAKAVRVATHVTEADISEQHIKIAKELGLFTVGFLMMAHMEEPEKIVEQARKMESYGADVVYVTDSAGALLPDGVRARVSALRNAVNIPIGFHAHNNLGVAVGNTLAALAEGATFVDGSLRGMGAGAGNAQTEVMVAALNKQGYLTNCDLSKLIRAAEDIVAPKMSRPQIIDSVALILGYAGVYSSFFLHAKRAAERFGVDALTILEELGKRRIVGGQEDQIIDVAYELSQKQALVR
ncbi:MULTISPECIES: 4-hydroxy-2-oxovalerate aldolase [Aneurinibacillus]|jgi:4-hydroxy 2-oxovalerate aldolase|uniref:4-hydroxy-2-oxovalerate aldolase n=1 Tax=Aneurinibacillus danicus TaxID=267746 RepID=A0A511V2W9_9BACL|nr:MULTISPECIES: 4-hydroxy-2-oxovalerate aldolase [Aneurinibacillus]GEN33257.1 4-hydroxy-2-oxovalerate aldolase [Aneurinibacillus danicus]